MIDAHVVVRRPDHTTDVRLEARPGEVVAVIGPTGAGKSTVLRALAGIVPLDAGHVVVDGKTWERASGARMPASRRGVGMVFQRQLLFPHLDALANVAFGPRTRGASRSAAEATARDWLGRLGVGDLAHRRPAELSGGQAQRVAVARALATDPAVLLLDEPLAALDVGVASSLRLELARHLTAFAGTTVLVTHDALDALTLASRVLVVDEGRVAQEGTPAEVAARPATEHVARLVGLNVLRGHAAGTLVRLEDGSELVTVTEASGPVSAVFSPAAVTLATEPPTGSARNRWRGTVLSASPHGAAVRVLLDTAGGLLADVTPGSAENLGLGPGRVVWASVKATEIAVNGPDQDDRLPSGHV